MIHIICGSSQKFLSLSLHPYLTFLLIKTFQHWVANHKAWSFWLGMHFDTLVQLFSEVGFITAFFRICFYLIYLIVLCRCLQVVLMISCSSFTHYYWVLQNFDDKFFEYQLIVFPNMLSVKTELLLFLVSPAVLYTMCFIVFYFFSLMLIFFFLGASTQSYLCPLKNIRKPKGFLMLSGC